MKIRIWPLLVMLGCFCCLCYSFISYADTYNFYFSKPKTGEAESETAGVEKSPTGQGQTITTPSQSSGAAPIVIHNVNNNNVGGQGQSVSSPSSTSLGNTPVGSVDPAATNQNVLAATVGSTQPSRWRLGVSAMGAWCKYSDDWQEYGYGHKGEKFHWGATASLSYEVSSWFLLNGFVGAQKRDGGNRKTSPVFGLEAEVVPLKIRIFSEKSLLDLSILAGAANIVKADSNIASLHLGARANINLSDAFAITGVVRANLGYHMFELGLVTKI